MIDQKSGLFEKKKSLLKETLSLIALKTENFTKNPIICRFLVIRKTKNGAFRCVIHHPDESKFQSFV